MIDRARPRLPFEVVDQNCLRNHALLARRAVELPRVGVSFAISATTIAEMQKAPEWRSTAARSLRFFTACPGQIEVLIPHRELIASEMADGQPATIVVDKLKTSNFRDLLVALGRGRNEVLEVFAETREYIASREHPFYDPEASLARFKEGMGVFGDVFTAADKKLLRKCDFGPLIDALSGEIGDKAIHGALQPIGGDERAWQLATTASYSATHVLLGILRYAQWISRGGADKVPAATTMNDRLDDSYIVYGAHGCGLLSRDKYATQRYDLLVRVLDLRWSRLGALGRNSAAGRPVA